MIMLILPAVMGFNVRQQDPVQWSYRADHGKDNSVVLRLVARISPGWHIYAHQQPKQAISQPTTIRFTASPLLRYQGVLREQGRKETYRDTVAGIVQYQYGDSVVYTQTVNLLAKVKVSASGTITYQACTGEMCLPPKTIPFSIPIQ